MMDYLSVASFNWIFTYHWSEDQMRPDVPINQYSPVVWEFQCCLVKENWFKSWLDDTVNMTCFLSFSSYLDVILKLMVVWCKFFNVTVKAATFLHPPSPPLSYFITPHLSSSVSYLITLSSSSLTISYYFHYPAGWGGRRWIHPLQGFLRRWKK